MISCASVSASSETSSAAGDKVSLSSGASGVEAEDESM